MASDSEYYTFGPHKIHPKFIFYTTNLSYAMVNLRPVLPGHILLRKLGIVELESTLRLKTCPPDKVARYFDIRTHVKKWNVVLALTIIHALVIPKREVKRFGDLNADEICDLWLTAQLVSGKLESYHNASSLTLNIQDGPEAGQSVPHVHIHIVPRKPSDFARNDDIYDAMDENDRALKQHIDLDEKRKDRGFEEMAQEADEYTKLFL